MAGGASFSLRLRSVHRESGYLASPTWSLLAPGVAQVTDFAIAKQRWGQALWPSERIIFLRLVAHDLL